ncbi:calcium-binding protein [Rhodovulum iodosum]|nr:calcium-binding protein [Rhodovulum robiginosum]
MTDRDGIVLSTYDPGEAMPELTLTVGTDSASAEITTLTSDLDGDGFNDFTLIFDGDVTGLGLELFESGGEYVIARQDYNGTTGDDVVSGNGFDNIMAGFGGDDELSGEDGDDVISGGLGADFLRGDAGADTIYGGDGTDTINGGDGDDTILGGDTEADRRDEIYGGDGNDTINAGYGNDLIYGMNGNDTIAGGFGADELQGQAGDDVITGSALSDLVFGGDGNDFVNGGFGFDRINGGDGADKFYHLGIRDHGSDWVQDYTAADGDVLLFGDATASADDFNVQFTHTSSPATGRSGDDDVQEAFVVYRPAGLIVWALVDGAGQDSLNIEIGGEVFDLLA